MNTPTHTTQLQLRSLIQPSGQLELSLAEIPIPVPAAHEVLVRIDAAPLNPSDLGLLFGAADMSTATQSGTPERPVVTAQVSQSGMISMARRVGESMPVGNEGAGLVVATGDSPGARALMGKNVAVLGGAMYSQYRAVPVELCLVLPDDASAADGASAFVNPLTALGMVETMRSEGHVALVHTAAASNLGRMLLRVCIHDAVPLVNIVRSDDAQALLREMGAAHVCNTSSPAFADELTDALAATRATIAFDATGGGPLAGQILSAMERAIGRREQGYNRYGSTVHKQVYLYGGLDSRPTEIVRDFGMAWSVGGWLVTPFLQRIGPAGASRLKQRIASELKTTFASTYARQISLEEALHLDVIAAYSKRATGEKFLLDPNKSRGR